MKNSEFDFSYFLNLYKNIKDILIIGGGPSIKNYDLQHLPIQDDLLIICCNQAFLQCPQAQISHHSDYSWWLNYQDQLKHFSGILRTGCGLGSNLDYPLESKIYKLTTARVRQLDLLFQNPNLIYGNNCGLQALSLAHLFQPYNIWLLGFDFRAEQGISHGYEIQQTAGLDHYLKFWPQFLRDFSRFEHLRKTAWQKAYLNHPIPQIYNLNPNSALNLYPLPQKIPYFLK